MRSRFIHSIVFMIAAGLIVTSCSSFRLLSPPGTHMGSLQSSLEMDNRHTRKFSLDLYRNRDDYHLYVSITGMYRYAEVEDISFDDGVHISLAGHDRTIDGKLSRDLIIDFSGIEGIDAFLHMDMED